MDLSMAFALLCFTHRFFIKGLSGFLKVSYLVVSSQGLEGLANDL